MIPEKMLEVLNHEGVVAIVTEGKEGPHVVNTWNSYLKITENKALLVPVGDMTDTEENLKANNKVAMTFGSKEVQGLHSMGTGFLIKGTAEVIYEGNECSEMKQNFPWARAVLKINPQAITQTL